MSQYYEIISFCSAFPNQVDKVIDMLDPKHLIEHRLYKHHTINVIMLLCRTINRALNIWIELAEIPTKWYFLITKITEDKDHMIIVFTSPAGRATRTIPYWLSCALSWLWLPSRKFPLLKQPARSDSNQPKIENKESNI